MIDERTTVFTLGRLVWHFGTRLSEQADDFCGAREVEDVVARACLLAPPDRWESVAAFARAWTAARRGG
jgi:serine/threonine-protein kinase